MGIDIYEVLDDNQIYNHFPANSELTTKAGLAKNLMASINQAGIHPDFYFPRWYDFGNTKQIEEFLQDFYRTALMNSLKKHAEYFWKKNKDSLEFIEMELMSIEPGINYEQARKSVENKYRNITKINNFWFGGKQDDFVKSSQNIETNHISSTQLDNTNFTIDDEDLLDDTQAEENKNNWLDEEDDLGWDENLIETGEHSFTDDRWRNTFTSSMNTDKVIVNCTLLRKIMSYIDKMIESHVNECEETEYYILNPKLRSKTKKFGSLKINLETNKLHRVLIKYSKLNFPHNYDSSKKNWRTPSLLLQYKALKLHQSLFKAFPQYHIDGKENIWISKPSYNARGNGIFI